MDVPDEVADRLYALPPRQFVAERDQAVSEAREAGDREAAAALAKLRRPTVGAWLVNLLALRRPELLAELADLAAALHTAQRDLQGEQLRELANQRRAAVSALVAAARSLAVEAEPELARAKLPLHEVEATLGAALADRDLAEQVRSGRLLKTFGYAGFGEPAGVQLRLVPGDAGRPEAAAAGTGEATEPDESAQAAQAAARAAAEAALAQAQAAAEAATAELDQVTSAKREATQELAEIDAALAELATRRAGAAGRLAEAESAELAARRAASVARNRLAEAERAVADG